MRHIFAGLMLAGVLVLSTLPAFAGDNSAKGMPFLPIAQARTFARPQPQDDAIGAAGASVAAPSITEWRGDNYDTRR